MFIYSDSIHEGTLATMLTDASNSSSSNGSDTGNNHAVRIINGSPPVFDCSRCQKGFKSKSSLKQHMHVHVSVKPYVCQACGKAYTEMTSLCRHRRKSCKQRSSQENKKHSQVCKENDTPALLDKPTLSKTENNIQNGSASGATPVKYISSLEVHLNHSFSKKETDGESSRKVLHNILSERPTFSHINFGLQRPLAGIYPPFLSNFGIYDNFCALPFHPLVNTSLNSSLNPILPQVLKESNINLKPVPKITNYSIENILSR